MIGALIFVIWVFGFIATLILYMCTDVDPTTGSVLIALLPVVNILLPLGYSLFLLIKGIRFLLKMDYSNLKSELSDVFKIFKF